MLHLSHAIACTEIRAAEPQHHHTSSQVRHSLDPKRQDHARVRRPFDRAHVWSVASLPRHVGKQASCQTITEAHKSGHDLCVRCKTNFREHTPDRRTRQRHGTYTRARTRSNITRTRTQISHAHAHAHAQKSHTRTHTHTHAHIFRLFKCP